MNVIISNKYQDALASLDIEVIKRMDGVFSAEDIVSTFQNFFFNKMILDLTALEDYHNLRNIQKLSIALDMSKIIFLLPPEPEFTSPFNLSKLIAMGIYNFTASVDGVMYLYNNPNSYRDVAQYHQIDEDNVSMNNGGFMGSSIGVETSGPQRIIGIKNLTVHSGATTLTYMMYEHLKSKYSVVPIEVDKRDFSYFNDKKMLSAGTNDIARVISSNSSAEVILIDINSSSVAENFCTQVIYLVEPSIIKLNKLLMNNSKVLDTVRNKMVVLNKSLLDSKDLNTFEYETRIKTFYNLHPIDDHKLSQEMYDFLRKLGFNRF